MDHSKHDHRCLKACLANTTTSQFSKNNGFYGFCTILVFVLIHWPTSQVYCILKLCSLGSEHAVY